MIFLVLSLAGSADMVNAGSRTGYSGVANPDCGGWSISLTANFSPLNLWFGDTEVHTLADGCIWCCEVARQGLKLKKTVYFTRPGG